MKKNLLGLILLMTTFSMSAQQLSTFNDAFYEVTIPGNGSIENLQDLSILHESVNSYDLVKNKRTIQGNIHSRYTISNSEFPVKAMEVTAHYSVIENETKFFIPRNLPKAFLNANKTQALDLNSILALAKMEFPAESYTFVGAPPYSRTNGLIYVPENYDFEKAKWILAYEIDIRSMEPHFSKRATFNAETGELITVEEKLCAFHSSCVSNTVPGTAVTKYHGTKEIETNETANGFELLDLSRGTGIETRDLNNGENLFTDDDNLWDNANAAQDEVAGDVHWGSMATYDFFLDEFDHDGIDDNGMGIVSLVHLDIANAFWNGVNATYGDGDPGTDLDLPLTYINIVGHEVAHGVTEFSNGLIYSNESGGLNEGFSDIMGTSIEDYTNPGVVDWLIGEDVSSTGFYFRNMADPKDVDMPHTYGGEFFSDFNGPHTMSSLANKWFQLLVEGGTGTNDNGYEYDVEALGWEVARLIAYNTWVNYLTPNSTYNDCGNFSLTETSILYGACSNEIAQVKEAWEAVGVLENTSTDDFSANSTFFCEIPATATFTSDPTTTNHMWEFGDGGTSDEANPSHEYTAAGTYTVSLMATNCDGEPFTTTKEDYIVLDSMSNNCDTLIMNGQTSMEICNGVVVDNGGGNGDYSNSATDVLTLTNEYNVGYNLSISDYNTESTFDFLIIQGFENGVMTTELIFDGVVPDQDIQILCDELVFTFTSDGSVTESGYIIDFSCIEPIAPVADFTSNGPIICSSIAQFTDISAGPPTSWEWYIDGVLASTEENPEIDLIDLGTYDVQLIACNMLGCDTLSIEDYITFNDTLPICDIIVMEDGTDILSNNCEGTLVDDGGTDNDYENNVLAVLEVDAPNSSMYEITVQTMNTESCCDDVRVESWNGSNWDFFTLLAGEITNEVFIVEGAKVRFTWDTDGSVTDEGFAISWKCLPITNPPDADFEIASQGICDGIFSVSDLSTNIAQTWEWLLDGELVSNEQNPEIILTAEGTYDLTLIVCNIIGCDTLTQVDILNFDMDDPFCSIIVTEDGQVINTSDCEGGIVDDGGPDGNYSNAFNGTVNVENLGSAGYTFDVKNFLTESGFDQLFIRVGNDLGSLTELNVLTGSVPDFTFVTSSVYTQFQFITDGSVTNPGYEIDFECIPIDTPPLATIGAVNNNCSSTFDFSAYSQNGDTFEWNFGDGNTDTGQEVTHTYETIGSFVVELKVTNDFGDVTTTLVVENTLVNSVHNAPGEMLINTTEFVEVTSHLQEDIVQQDWFVNDVYIHSNSILDLMFATVSTNTVRCDVRDLDNCVTSYETIVEAREVLSNENEELASQIGIFPNPTTGELTLTNLSLFNNDVTITVTNTVGQLITRQKLSGNADVHALDISSASSGVYFVSIQDDENKVYKKITKIQ